MLRSRLALSQDVVLRGNILKGVEIEVVHPGRAAPIAYSPHPTAATATFTDTFYTVLLRKSGKWLDSGLNGLPAKCEESSFLEYGMSRRLRYSTAGVAPHL